MARVWRATVAWLPVSVLAAACGSPTGAAPVSRPRPAPRADQLHASRLPLRQVETIRPVAAEPGRARPAGARNPFSFGTTGLADRRAGSSRGLPPSTGQGLREFPLPLPGPDVTLLGIAVGREHPPVRTAVLSVDGNLVLAHVGDRLAGRFAVTAIGEESVDLMDQAGGRALHLAWP
jgi:hypothetical protein